MLTDPTFWTSKAGGTRWALTLPGVFEGLVAGTLENFLGLAPHQAQAWWSFLVQLAAMATEGEELPRSEKAWKARLLALTQGKEDPWNLIVDDTRKPAFLQPPSPKGIEDWNTRLHTIDEIDVLATAKNHDVKGARARHALPENWAYTLVNLQTMSGSFGAGNHGIARMNGGLGGRLMIGVIPGVSYSRRFIRDLRVLRDAYPGVLKTHGYSATGHRLLWLVPWTGALKDQVKVQDLHPWFIEVARRVRLVMEDGELVIYKTTSEGTRVDAKARKGYMGDPWIPIALDGPTAVTVGDEGLTYRKLHTILFSEKVLPSAAQQITAEDICEDLQLYATVLVRGQGKTGGLHERIIPIPRDVQQWVAHQTTSDTLRACATLRVQFAGLAASKALGPALRKLMGDDHTGSKDVKRWVGRLLQQFDKQVDARFFGDLFGHFLEPDGGLPAWVEWLIKQGQDVLKTAIDTYPVPTMRRYRLISQATGLYLGCAHKHVRGALKND